MSAEVETRPDLGGSGPQSRSVLAVAGRKRQPEYDSASKVRAFAVRAKSSTNVTLSTLAPMRHPDRSRNFSFNITPILGSLTKCIGASSKNTQVVDRGAVAFTSSLVVVKRADGENDYYKRASGAADSTNYFEAYETLCNTREAGPYLLHSLAIGPRECRRRYSRLRYVNAAECRPPRQ